VAETLDRAVTNLDLELAAQPGLRAQLQATLGATYQSLGLYRDAIPLQEKARDYYLKTFGLEHANTLGAIDNLAQSYFDAGRKDEALKLREEVLKLCRKVLGPETLETLGAMNNLAISYFLAGRTDEALKLREELLPLERKVNGPEHPHTLSSMNNLANSYFGAGRKDEALKLREELLLLFRKVNGPEHPETLLAMNDLSWILATSDVATIRNGTNAVQLAEAAVAATSRKNADYLDTLAAAYAETQRFDKAAAAEREAIALYQTEQQKKDAGSRLSLYQAHRPYRE
jgi:tetratricopeptide (TPR) repeat protein